MNISAPIINPFKSLHYYREEDQAGFFGRDTEIDEFLHLFRRDVLSVLFARSGLGKTSLLRAGVIPQLRKENVLPVIVRINYADAASPPGSQIIDAVRTAAALHSIEIEDANDVASLPTETMTLWEFFHRYQFWSRRNDPIVPALILDQFEEIFTQGKQNPETPGFIEELADLAENRMPRSFQARLEAAGARPNFDTKTTPYKLILSLREDFVPKLDALRSSMPCVMRNRFALGALDGTHGVNIVLSAGGQWISASVAQEIVVVVAGGNKAAEQTLPTYNPQAEIEPAYLSILGYELFRKMQELGRNAIDSDLVDAEQGNILDDFYQRSFAGLKPETRLFVEDRLLAPSGFRVSAPLSEAAASGVPLHELDSLVECRLLRLEDRLGATHVELSHDKLIGMVQKSRDLRRAALERQAEKQREAKLQAELRRSKRHFWAAVALILALTSASGLWIYLYQWPYQIYCRGFSKRLGMIHPIELLPDEAVQHRAWTLRLTSEGRLGKVYKAEAIDANGQLTPNHDIGTLLGGSSSAREKESRWEFIFDRQGYVSYEIAWDRFDRMVWGFQYAPRPESNGNDAGPFAWLKHLFIPPPFPESATAAFIGADGFPKPQRNTPAEYVEIHYDRNGFESHHYYKDRASNAAPGLDDAYGREMRYDDQGRMNRLTSLDKEGKPMNDAAGNAGLSNSYETDDDKTIEKAFAFDANNEPVLVKAGFSSYNQAFDEWGRLTREKFFGLSGEPIKDRRSGAHLIEYNYDQHGNTIGVKLFGEPNNSDGHEPGISAASTLFEFPAHEKRMTYDQQNRVSTIAYFDEQGNALAHPEAKWHGYEMNYDSRGFKNQVCYFDQQRQPISDQTTGFHCWESTNDGFGQRREIRYLNEKHEPVANHEGYQRMTRKYDKAGNIVEEAFFASDQVKVVGRSSGAHKLVYTRDRFGNPLTSAYFDQNDRKIDNKQGFHRVETAYNDYGLPLRTRWYDKDGKACSASESAHDLQILYDDRGLKTQVNYFDQNGKPVAVNGIHEARFDYNDKRQQIKYQAFGLNSTPAEDTTDGTHLQINDYDSHGRETQVTKLRADGSPNWDRNLGIATWKRAWDKQNRQIEQAFFDQHENRVTGPLGCAHETTDFTSDRGEGSIYTCYGLDDKPILNPVLGYAAREIRKTPESSTTSYFGPDGALIDGPDGYARDVVQTGSTKSIAYYAADGSNAVGLQGYHRVELISADPPKFQYFDTEDKPITLGAGVATVFYVKAIRDFAAKQPAYKLGLHVGDVLWRYGTWSFPDSAAKSANAAPEEIFASSGPAFTAEIQRLATQATTLTVIRRGKRIDLAVPQLPEKRLGIEFNFRLVPTATFKAWKTLAANQ